MVAVTVSVEDGGQLQVLILQDPEQSSAGTRSNACVNEKRLAVLCDDQSNVARARHVVDIASKVLQLQSPDPCCKWLLAIEIIPDGISKGKAISVGTLHPELLAFQLKGDILVTTFRLEHRLTC
jgi:hypothetical protein